MSTAMIQPVARPTPEQIDQLADRYNEALKQLDAAEAAFAAVEKEAIDLVQLHGIVPPRAENSRRLEGKLTEFTVTVGNTITIDETRVDDLKEALKANGFEAVFSNLFIERVRHELVKDAKLAILAAGMPKRLTNKIQALFGRCFDANKKKPVLKVKTVTVAKPKRLKKEVA
jgi:hypothetical protein